MNIKKAIIPAAGLGTRFLPATKAMPKEMLPIIDKPVIQFIVEEAISSGIEDILIITGRNKRAIADHFDKSYELEATLEQRQKYDILAQIREISRVNIHFIRQKEPNGLGDAVLQARSFIGTEPFALLLGDDIVETPAHHPPCTKQLIEKYEDYGCPIIGVQTVTAEQVPHYGIIQSDRTILSPGETAPIFHLVEKPKPETTSSRIAIMGRYILNSSIFDILAHTPKGIGNEIQLTDALRISNQQTPMLAYHFHGIRHDVGTPLGFLKANLLFALSHSDYRAQVWSLIEEVLHQSPLERSRSI